MKLPDKWCAKHLTNSIIRAPDPYGISTFANGELGWILDLGAHAGAFAMCARFRHPSARVVAVEASPDNYAVLVENAAYLDIDTINVAIGLLGRVEIVEPKVPTRRTASMQHWCTSCDSGRVESITLAMLASRCKLSTDVPGFVKMDIEGAEESVFGDSDSIAFLSECAGVSVEVHAKSDTESCLPLCEHIESILGRTHSITSPYRKHRGALVYGKRL